MASMTGQKRTLATEATAKRSAHLFPDGRERKEKKFLGIWTSIPTRSCLQFFVVWIHNTSIIQENLREINLSKLRLAVPPSDWPKKMQTTSGRAQLSPRPTADFKTHSKFKQAKIWKIYNLKSVKYCTQVNKSQNIRKNKYWNMTKNVKQWCIIKTSNKPTTGYIIRYLHRQKRLTI